MLAEHFPTASIIKVLIVATAYRRQNAARRRRAVTIEFNSSDLIGGSDFMSLRPGRPNIHRAELIVPTITVSDNTAANLLIGYFGVDAINATAGRAGMIARSLRASFSTTRDRAP